MRAQRRREAAASSLAEGMRQRQQAQGAGAGAAAEDRGGAGAAELAALNKEVGELRSALAEAKQASLAAANPPPPPPAKPPVGGEEAGPLLVIAVNTIPRPSDEDYLMQALDSISAQLKDGDNSVAVYVLNLRPGKHAVFAAAQKRYAADGR